MKHAYELMISMHHRGDLSVDTMLSELQQFAAPLSRLSENLGEWLLGGNTKEEAFLYDVFKNGAPTTASKAVLETQLKGKTDPRCIVVWNGLEGHEGASIEFIGRPTSKTSLVTLVGRPKSFSSNWRLLADVVKEAVRIWSPDYITLESNGYADRKAFKNRPGVGWMIYLPLVLSEQHVPEARALVPITVVDENGRERQVGTIVVSVTDEAFSDENPDHVLVANAIEVRLADKDLLPRYVSS
jgi:hypothetical protein